MCLRDVFTFPKNLIPLVRSVVLRGDHLSFRVSVYFQFFVYRTYSICFWFVRRCYFQSIFLKGLFHEVVVYIWLQTSVEQKGGETLESLSFLGLPHQTNGEREDPRAMEGGMFFCSAADSFLTQSSRALTPVKIFVTIVLEPLWYLCSSFCLLRNRRKSEQSYNYSFFCLDSHRNMLNFHKILFRVQIFYRI